MKKVYLFAAAAALCSGQALAQSYAPTLENNQVFYLTNDTCTIQEVMVEDEDTGEEVAQMQETYWMGTSLSPAYKAVNLPLTGASSTKANHIFQTRQDYTDSETGFTMPAGYYRGIFVDGTTSLQGYDLSENYVVGYKNVKAVILYLVPQPNYWNSTTWSPYFSDYPTGRVQARYMQMGTTDEEAQGVAISNQAYREIHIKMSESEEVINGETYVNATTKTCNYERSAENWRNCTIDQVYKVKFNLDNQLDGSAYESEFASADKKSEYSNLVCSEEGYETELSYYFADVNTTRPYTDNEAFSSCATGYDCYDNKWGEKLTWSSETITQIEIKKRLYLAGYAIICGTDGATTKFINTSDGKSAAWSDSAKAYGNYTDNSGIENISTNAVADRSYDLNGRISRTTKGLTISGGKVMFAK